MSETNSIKSRILYEDNHVIVIVKQHGEISQGDKTGDETLPDLLKAYIKEKYNKPGEVFLGVVHRLDRPVGGVMVFARTSKALERLNESFREGKARKTYLAVTCAKPAP
ncbi:MAG: pseudouridine synthase, partial [Bacteroidales bacterium]|nr:pseudouridine synthase [Bacteroidales bacterium]